MIPLNRILLAGGTVASAIGIGFVMQHSGGSDAAVAQAPAVQVQPAQAGMATTASAQRPAMRSLTETALPEAPAPQISDIELTSATDDLPEAPADMVELSDAGTELAAAEPEARAGAGALNQPGAACDPVMTAQQDAAAMVQLALTSCQPGARVTLHHNGMMVSYATDADGALSVQLPALSESAVFIAAFKDGTGAVATAQVPSLRDYERVVLQWQGDSGFQLHAREFGADYGSQGHVWGESKGSLGQTLAGQGGMMTRHGDFGLAASLRAEVYTFPAKSAARNGDVEITVEAELTDANCAREVSAQAIQFQDGGALSVQELVMDLPECDGQGGFLLLKNLIQDLKIARN